LPLAPSALSALSAPPSTHPLSFFLSPFASFSTLEKEEEEKKKKKKERT